MKKLVHVTLVTAAFMMGAQSHAGWMLIDDTTAAGGAINPGPANIAPAGPDNQNADAIKTWLNDLISTDGTNPGDAGDFLGGGDSTPGTLTGLDALGAVYIVLHYGNHPDYGGINKGNVNIAYYCDSDCDTFTGYATAGLSNHRIYGVPEPGTLALMTLGLAGLALRKKFIGSNI